MLSGRVLQGEVLEQEMPDLFSEPRVGYLHVHNAGRGCYAYRVDRA